MRIGVFCSGGDAPGMNACVRAVVRTALGNGHEVVGIRRGYQGLLDADFYGDGHGPPLMDARSVGDWTRHGGTYLYTSRCEEFRTPAGQQKAADILDRHGIEVMGRCSGYLAVHTALSSAAETVCILETPTNIPDIIRELQTLKQRGKSSVMMIVAEGDDEGGAAVLHEALNKAGSPFSMRVVILGHLQRGGSPTPEDRLLASRLGDWAVRALLEGATGVMAGLVGGKCELTPFPQTYVQHKPIPPDLLLLVENMAH